MYIKKQIIQLKWDTDLNRMFSKEETYKVEKHLKKSLRCSVIWEMNIKNTLGFHLIPVRWTRINIHDSSFKTQSKWYTHTFLRECKLVQLLKSVWQFLRKLYIILPYKFCIIIRRHLLSHNHCYSLHNNHTVDTD